MVTRPDETATYLLNQPVIANYTRTDAESGITSCAGPDPTGGTINTATTGPHTFTVLATDGTRMWSSAHADDHILPDSSQRMTIHNTARTGHQQRTQLGM